MLVKIEVEFRRDSRENQWAHRCKGMAARLAIEATETHPLEGTGKVEGKTGQGQRALVATGEAVVEAQETVGGLGNSTTAETAGKIVAARGEVRKAWEVLRAIETRDHAARLALVLRKRTREGKIVACWQASPFSQTQTMNKTISKGAARI